MTYLTIAEKFKKDRSIKPSRSLYAYKKSALESDYPMSTHLHYMKMITNLYTAGKLDKTQYLNVMSSILSEHLEQSIECTVQEYLDESFAKLI